MDTYNSKKAVIKKSSSILDDKYVLTLLRSSFFQQLIGELKTCGRKLVHFGHARRQPGGVNDETNNETIEVVNVVIGKNTK